MGLITAGAIFAAVHPGFAAAYNTFATAILAAKGVGQLASFGNNYINAQDNDVPNTTTNVVVEDEPIVPSTPVPKAPIGPIED